jgi:hypothetical protein
MFSKKQNIVIFIYELDTYTNHRIDFLINRSSVENAFYDLLLNDFNTTQIIQHDSIKATSNIDFYLKDQYFHLEFDRIKRKPCSDLIISSSHIKLLFPYSFGHYLYLIFEDNLKQDVHTTKKWLDEYLRDRFKDIDKLYAGQIKQNFEFLKGLEFAVITNYDSNRDIGIVLIKEKLNRVLNWINQLQQNESISNWSYESYNDCERESILKNSTKA